MKKYWLVLVSYLAGVLVETVNPPGWQWPIFGLSLVVVGLLCVAAKRYAPGNGET